MDIYEQLRTIGVSVETADALARVLETMPKRKQEAFVLWAMGYSERQVSRICKISTRTIWYMIKDITRKAKCS
ncbi:MAG: hypothetical protein C0436_00280 [Alphaproteobacteria bacterium]|nr:hypothetical protein [Alphaproteobacteria bacterium]